MNSRGSIWHRWEPHIHAPGTLFNDQFKGPSAWEDYISALESATPVIEAIAVTDYYVTDTYEHFVQQKKNGRMPSVGLIFPNIELRLDAATSKGGFVNLHLFVSPEDPNHVAEITRFLARLLFRAFGDDFDCTRADLIRLGKAADPSIVDDLTALRFGASQYKVNFTKLREAYSASAWAKENVLVAVAGGASDGTSGVREAADQTIRKSIESFAHIIFSSSQAQYDFWLGRKSLSAEEIRRIYGGLKPCLHGSDAHELDKVATPFDSRHSWIKGGLEFDSLRQACIDPSNRAKVSAESPKSAVPSQVISSIQVSNAPWLKTTDIQLNPGLIAIIGARGSGKTALADMIAVGADSISDEAWTADEWSNPSFVIRAKTLLGSAKVKVTWASGDSENRCLDGSDANGAMSYPRARYLSQQFVEDLCSSSGMTDKLLREIERVIFEAHPLNDRDGALDFGALLDLRASRFRLARNREAEAVAHISEQISIELEKQKLVTFYNQEVAKIKKRLKGYVADRAKLVSAGSEKRAKRHAELAEVAGQLSAKLSAYTNQRQAFLALQDEVKDRRQNKAPETLRQTQSRHPHSGMTDAQWAKFLTDYKGNVDSDLPSYISWVDTEISKIVGVPPPPGDPAKALFPDDTDLSKLTKAMLEAEMARLESLVNADKTKQRQYTALTKRIAAENASLQVNESSLEDAKLAKSRAQDLAKQREEAYSRAFEALIAEQSVLEELYQPLMSRLSAASGTLKKLSFTVTRVADVEKWAGNAEEELLDLRKSGELKGKGKLVDIANNVLKSGWEQGSASEVVQAMNLFRDLHQEELLAHAPVAYSAKNEFRDWSKRFAQWLYGTDHIDIKYGIEYDGVDIRKLSPGTRGIVLLLLYLALDDADDRPLIIDQPEENLDPRSVFEELVGLFVSAKSNRQVIMVTHNANLVINTDADQVIIAESGPHPLGELPPITYYSGGLENTQIRKTVCDILEGGEGAFQERARRLRVRLER